MRDVRRKERNRRKWPLFMITGVLTYLLFLVALLPAGFVWSEVERRGIVPEEIALLGVHGTVWEGGVGTMVLPEGVTAAVQWSTAPSDVLKAHLSWDVSAQLLGGQIDGRLSFGSRQLTVKRVRGDFSAPAVVGPFLEWPVDLTGRIALELTSVVLTYGGRLQEMHGTVGWLNGGAGMGKAIPLGDLRAVLEESGQGGIKATLKDTGGPLMVEGIAELQPAGRVQVEGIAGTRRSADQSLVEALQMVGRADAAGRRKFRFSGTLNALN